ncbi:hypothetical protein MKX08_009542 [Trichoderma sp. CBMAI-0020]|nr:hypothetical protein MKX08_009542 [Trichoderma sp. CBMAI-0020]
MASSNSTSHTPDKPYSVVSEAANVLKDGILNHPQTVQHLISGLDKYADLISFEGSDNPSLPVNWRFAESIAALKGLESIYVNAILEKVYGVAPQKVKINTDHALLFIMSLMLWSIDPEGRNVTFGDTRSDPSAKALYHSLFKDYDVHRSLDGPYRCCTSSMYKTKDGKFYHIHGSMNPDRILDMLNLPREPPTEDTFEKLVPIFAEKVAQLNSDELDKLSNDVWKQAGSICYPTDEYKATEHGKANAHVGLWETWKANEHQAPTWWTDNGKKPSDPSRPLAGLKVLDATRIIAAPIVSRGLAELGASVLRITSPSVPDATLYHPELNWGKWNASLDFKKEEDRQKMKELILECDVFISSYRPKALAKYGFDADDVLEMCKGREKGIIVVRMNSYGWNGPLQDRSGWQQISDAFCGVSYEFGRAMGNDEPVTAIFPNTDFCAGISGICAVMDAVVRRGETGGSYKVNLALDYYTNWLINNVGTYPEDVWKELWGRYGSPVFRHHDHMLQLLFRIMPLLKERSGYLFDPSYFETRPAPNLGVSLRTVKPVLQFPDGVVKPGFTIGTRGNGVDKAEWPADLKTQTDGEV